jgi:uncharacterized protein (TIGR02246 family)
MKLNTLSRRFAALAAAGAAVIALSTTAFAATSPRPAQAPTAPAIATDWAAAWNGDSPQALSNLFTPDATYTDLAIGATMNGRDQIAEWKLRTDELIANVHVTVTEAFRSGDHVAIETVYSGQVHGAPRAFAVPVTTILEMRGNRIASDRDYYNLAALLAQSGLPATWTPPTTP